MSNQARFKRVVIEWHRSHARSFPWRETVDPYEVLIGEVLLQRTRGEQVVTTYAEFLRRWPTPNQLARARVSTIEAVIRPIGLRKRAATLKRLGVALAGLNRVPTEPTELATLPGVGPYAAHAVSVFALGRDLPLVDWVIARVLRRYFGLQDEPRPNSDRPLWELASTLARLGNARELWLGTLDLAAGICGPIPGCADCPLAGGCGYAADRGLHHVGGTR